MLPGHKEWKKKKKNKQEKNEEEKIQHFLLKKTSRQKEKNPTLKRDNKFDPRNLSKRNEKTYPQRNSHIITYSSILIAKDRKQFKCPSTCAWMNKCGVSIQESTIQQ